MKFDLKTLRERKGMTAEEFAQALTRCWNESYPQDPRSFTMDMVIRMEKRPGRIDADTMDLICKIYGMTYEQLRQPPHLHLEPPEIKDNWQEVSRWKEQLEKDMENLPAAVKEKYKPALKEYRGLLAQSTRKLKIALEGHPDAGKSTMLNQLIGKEIIPTNWTPTTSSVAIVKDIQDRPKWFAPNTVAVLRDGADWDCFDAEDEDTVQEREEAILAKGDYSLIAEYGAHDGAHAEESVGCILVYVDSPLLRNCDFVDLPGFNPLGSGPVQDRTVNDPLTRDTMLSSQALDKVAGLIYLSPANSYLYGDDLTMAAAGLRAMTVLERRGENKVKPFGNVFFVATQANTVAHGDLEQLARICDDAANRVWKQIEGSPKIEARRKDSHYDCGLADLRKRFFTSEMESPALTEAFYQDLAAFLQELPLVQKKRISDEIQLFRKGQAAVFADAVNQYKAIRDDHNAARARLDAMDEGESERAEALRSSEREATDIILAMQQDTRSQCRAIYSRIINAENIVRVIEENGFKKNKRDLQELVSLLNAMLENQISAELTDKARKLEEEINVLLNKTQRNFDRAVNTGFDMNASLFNFNVGRAFAGGLSGLAAFGALSAWAASCGNLGGYILVAKAAGVLSSVGIHVGGAAAATAGVAALGGPVVLGIAIAVLAAVTVLLMLGGTWKKVIGNKIAKIYAEKGVPDKLLEACDKYWEDTLTAFRAGMEQVEQEWQAQRREYRKRVEDLDEDTLAQDIEDAEQIRDFFAGKVA